MNVSGKELESPISGAELLGIEDTDDGKGWAQNAYFFFRAAEHYDEG